MSKFSFLLSIIFIFGSGILLTLWLIETFLYLSFLQLNIVSTEGVAELRITGQLEYFALTIAKSLVLIIIFSSCLYDVSCSSSTIIKRRLEKGRKIAERVPTITSGLPSIANLQIFFLSEILIEE